MDFETKLAAIFEGKEPREFSSTQVDLPVAKLPEVIKIQKSIPEEDLAGDGLEDHIHVTVKYGLHTDDADEVRKIVKGSGPIHLTLGLTDIFSSDQHDVLIIKVDSDDLHALNKKIKDGTKCTDTYPTYKPHLTIAYLKSGTGEKYKDRDDVAGLSFDLDEIVFSGKSKQLVKLPLK